jgi:hypothetical protein
LIVVLDWQIVAPGILVVVEILAEAEVAEEAKMVVELCK